MKMAMTTANQIAITNGGFVTRALAALAERLERRATFRKCVAELAALSDRELRDLGLHRSMIRSLAYEEAYRSM